MFCFIKLSLRNFCSFVIKLDQHMFESLIQIELSEKYFKMFWEYTKGWAQLVAIDIIRWTMDSQFMSIARLWYQKNMPFNDLFYILLLLSLCETILNIFCKTCQNYSFGKIVNNRRGLNTLHFNCATEFLIFPVVFQIYKSFPLMKFHIFGRPR